MEQVGTPVCLAFWGVWVEGHTTMVHSEVLVGSHMILQTIHISSGWDSLSPLFPSSQDLPLPIKSLGLSSSEREEGKKSGSRFLSEVGERREESNSTARGSHEATGRDTQFSRSTGN